jgi:hypothetical protein
MHNKICSWFSTRYLRVPIAQNDSRGGVSRQTKIASERCFLGPGRGGGVRCGWARREGREGAARQGFLPLLRLRSAFDRKRGLFVYYTLNSPSWVCTPTVERAHLNCVQCGFESHHTHLRQFTHAEKWLRVPYNLMLIFIQSQMTVWL